MTMKPAIMWAIYGEYGLYTDTAFTRKEMIRKHCIEYCPLDKLHSNGMLKRIWRKCKERGDRAVRVEVRPLLK